KELVLLRKANCGTERGQPKRVVSYAVPMVRIHLPPALSPLRTSFSGGERGKVGGDDRGRSRRWAMLGRVGRRYGGSPRARGGPTNGRRADRRRRARSRRSRRAPARDRGPPRQYRGPRPCGRPGTKF